MLQSNTLHVDVIGLGEALWDCFPQHRLPGGAPANVAFHAQQLGLTAAVATRVGNDPFGEELLDFFRRQGLRTDLVQRDAEHPTGTNTITFNETGTQNCFLENCAWDYLEATEAWLHAAAQAKSICFGTLAQRSPRSRATIDAVLEAASPECLIVFDVNLRPPHFERTCICESLRRARIVKLSDEEVRVLAALFETQTTTDDEFARWIIDNSPAELVCITRGSAGAIAVTADEFCEVSGIPIRVADTVGAGDAFTAAIIWSRLNRWPLRKSVELANRLGALVAGRSGAMPELRDEIQTLTADFAD